MNILIVDHLGIYRLGLKALIEKGWANARVYEAHDFEEMMTCIYEEYFDLIMLDVEIMGNEHLEEFIHKASKYTKIVILSELEQNHPRINKLLAIGGDALISKAISKEQLINTLSFLLSQALAR